MIFKCLCPNLLSIFRVMLYESLLMLFLMIRKFVTIQSVLSKSYSCAIVCKLYEKGKPVNHTKLLTIYM